MFVHFKEKFMYWNELGKKILFFILLTILVFPTIGHAKTESTNNENKHKTNVINGEITPEHLVKSVVLFDEIYDINISEGHYRISAELMMTWEADTTQFLSEFGDNIILGEILDVFLEKISFIHSLQINFFSSRSCKQSFVLLYLMLFIVFQILIFINNYIVS